MVKALVRPFVDKRSKFYQYMMHFIFKKAKYPSVGHLINYYASHAKTVTFMQIGANEGLVNDPLYHNIRLHQWSGVLVEPFEEAFQKLKYNHFNNPRLIFEKVAISDESKDMPFYYVEKKSPDVPDWVSQLNSFDKSITTEVQEKFGTLVEIKEMQIPCTTVEEILTRNNIPSLDLLLIDTEGHDYEILKTIELKRWNPEIVIFEHRHLEDADFKKALDLLKRDGYQIYKDDYDTIGLKNKAVIEKYRSELVD